jgi:hypothetical protein
MSTVLWTWSTRYTFPPAGEPNAWFHCAKDCRPSVPHLEYHLENHTVAYSSCYLKHSLAGLSTNQGMELTVETICVRCNEPVRVKLTRYTLVVCSGTCIILIQKFRMIRPIMLSVLSFSIHTPRGTYACSCTMVLNQEGERRQQSLPWW